jgi:DNA-binding winged helix-turn-helix (wHTH) protein
VQEVWGYDYFGGTRTVDVHVRRLRAKLGVEYEAMIGTVRNVGYKFVRPAEVATSRRDSGRESSRSGASSSPADSEDNVADLERRFNAPS